MHNYERIIPNILIVTILILFLPKHENPREYRVRTSAVLSPFVLYCSNNNNNRGLLRSVDFSVSPNLLISIVYLQTSTGRDCMVATVNS